MKFTPKHAVAALAIAIAGQASAQTIHNLPDTGNSSFYFVALDEIAGRSYFGELVANAGSTTVGALRLDDLISNPTGNWTITLSGLNTFAAGSASLDNLFGGFGAADSSATLGGGTTPATGNRRLVTSVAEGAAAPTFSNSQVTGGGVNYANFAGTVNAVCPTGPCIATNPSEVQYAAIPSGPGLQWGFPSGALIADAFTGTIAWDIYRAVSSSTVLSAQSTVTALALHAVLDLASNTLTISGPSSPVVPIPAAIWLLGSAMLGLVGIGRRKKGQIGQFADGAVAA
jgi:hypothetical protein